MTGNISTNYNAEQTKGYRPVASDSYTARVTMVNFVDGTFTAEGLRNGAPAVWFTDEVTLDRIAREAREGDKVIVSATLMRRAGVDQQG